MPRCVRILFTKCIMNYSQLLDALKQNSDERHNQFNNVIVNSGVRTIGCTIPFVRRLAKSVTTEEAESFPVHDCYEADLLRGIVVASCKLPFAEKIVHLNAFVQTIENWAVCDSSTVKPPRSERELYFAYFCDMLPSDKPFVCRYGIVNLMSGYLDGEHIGKIFAQLSKIAQWGQYYVDMGVAWLLATAMCKCRDETVSYMEGEARNIVSKFAYNKALQKMRDRERENPL